MHQSLDYLCQLPHIECLRCDRNFTIIQTSSGCGHFLDDETLIEMGQSVLDVIPELFGLEESLIDIIEGNRSSFELKAISRQLSDGTLHYYDLYVVGQINSPENLDRSLNNSSKLATIFLEDVTQTLSFMQTLVQAGNEMTLLLDQLQQTNQELTRSTRLKDEFLANMSYEIRTPLNAILGMTEGLQEEVFGIINLEQLKALETIESSGAHLLELINDVLDIAKIESGQIKLECARTAVVPLCESSLSFIKQQALKKQIRLEMKLVSDVPDLFVEKRRIRQVLINLLNNAVKFTPEHGKISLEVTFPLSPEVAMDVKNPVQIAVVDTGIGIAPENLRQLFQPFIQIDSSLNRKYQGTGLGLSLVKRIVELHRGQVGVSSEVGVGSRFTIILPGVASASSSAQPGVQSQLNIVTNLSQKLTTPTILLAEDNAANLSTIFSYLRAKGYHLIVAHTEEDAITLAETETPNIIVINMGVSGINGIEVIQRIRLNPHLVNVPIIALKMLPVCGDREKYLEAGANAFLRKPVKLKNLLNSIQQLI
ncbi:MAG: ATP-binding protein [Cyanobacteria bacterium J06592_8]